MARRLRSSSGTCGTMAGVGHGCGAQQLRHPPGQHAGQMLVAVVLVAEPLRARAAAARTQEAGVVHHDVVGVAQAHRERTPRWGRAPAMAAPSTGATSAGVGRSAGARYWWSANSSHSYADSRTAMAAASSSRRTATTSSPATKPPERVPLRGHVGVGGRSAAQHGDDGRVVVAREEVPGSHGGVVEMRGDDEDATEGGGVDLTPGRLGERVAHARIIRARRRSHRRRGGGRRAAARRSRAAPTMQARPPETTENSMLVSVATAPDSMSPRRGPPCTTAIWMEDMRLRKRSGMELCSMVLRRTAEMTSAHPATAKRTRATQRVSANPNSAMAAPQTQHRHDHRPTLPAQVGDPPRGHGPDQRADARRGVEEAQGDGAAPEDRARHGREERPRHAEHHGVDVDQVDALERLARAQIAQPLPGRLPGRERRRRGRPVGSDAAWPR